MKKFLLPVSLLLNSCFLHAQFSVWSEDPAVNLLGSTKNSADLVLVGPHYHPSAGNAVLEDSWMAFYSFNQVSQNYDMRVQYINYNGDKKFGDTGILISTKKSGTATFVFNACRDYSDNLYVGFQYEKNGRLVATLQKVTPEGQLPWGVEGVDLGQGLVPFPVCLYNSEIAVAWENNGDIFYQKIAQDGTRLFTQAKQINRPKNVTRPQLVAQSNNGFGMVFQESVSFPIYTNLYMQRFDNNGDGIWAAPVSISTITTASVRYYDMKPSGDTTFVGYYGNAAGQNRFDAFVQRVNPNGSLPYGPDGSAFADFSMPNELNEQTISLSVGRYHYERNDPIVAAATLTDPGQTKSGIYIQKFDRHTGERLWGNNAKEVVPVSNKLALLASEVSKSYRYSVAYTDNTNGIYVAGFDQEGVPLWGGQVPLATTANLKGRFAGGFYTVCGLLGMYASGCFVYAWQEDRGEGERPYLQNLKDEGTLGNLPVVITGFKGLFAGKHINLNWATATEQNNKGFYIQRSLNGQSFQNIGFVGSLAFGGNSSKALEYNFMDMQPQIENYYRLVQQDLDGKQCISQVIKVHAELRQSIRCFPNPASNKLFVQIPAGIDTKQLIITDVKGRQFVLPTQEVSSGEYIINIESLSAGLYYLVPRVPEFTFKAVHFIKQ